MNPRLTRALLIATLALTGAGAWALGERVVADGARTAQGDVGIDHVEIRASWSPALREFAEEVVPVLDSRCGACHGLEGETFDHWWRDEGRGALLRWRVDASGAISGADDIELAHLACMGDAAEVETIVAGEPALASPLLRAPLSDQLSAHPHAHPAVFESLDDPDLRALAAWVDAEAKATQAHPRPSSAAQVFFDDRVMPILDRKGCLGANCHGRLAFNDLRLDPGMPALEPRWTARMLGSNRTSMLGAVTRLVALDGDVEQSKQLLKIIPIEQGGIVHKGGNAFLERGDPDYQVVVEWLKLEARALAEETGTELGASRGMIFVRRPRHTPERFLETAGYFPGAQLVWRQGEQEVVLSDGLGGSELDIRAPDVSFDARSVAFAMRRAADQPLDIWEIDLESREARQLTFSEDPDRHFIEPLYVPDPQDLGGRNLSRSALMMVSNHAGEFAPASPGWLLGEAEGGTRTTIHDTELDEHTGRLEGRTLTIVAGTNRGQSRRIRSRRAGQLTVSRPFAAATDSTTHYAVETKARVAPRYDAYRMARAASGEERETFDDTLQRMTFTVDQVRRPTLRSDGSPIFTFVRTGWQGGRPYFNGALYRCHIDGSDFHPHNGNRSGIPLHTDDRELADGLEIRVGRGADSYWGGILMLSDHQFGVTIEDDNPLDALDHPATSDPSTSSSFRFVPGWISLDPSVEIRGVSEGGAYRDPYPLPDGSILVAHAPGPLDLDDPNADPNFGILRLVPDPALQSTDGRGPGRFRSERVVDGPLAEVWPRPVVVRSKPPVTKVMKTDVLRHGEPSLVRGFVGYPDGTPATVQVYDYPVLDAFFEHTAPAGTRSIAGETDPLTGRPVPRSQRIDAVRIVLASPLTSPSEDPPRRAVLLEAPIAPDGSVHLTIPSGTSFTFQSINPDGIALRELGRWLYVRPGEKYTLSTPRELFPQMCGGCHGSLTGEMSDTLAVPDAMTSASRTVATWDAESLTERPPWNENVLAIPRRVTFDDHIRPIIERRCLSCHGLGSSTVPAVAPDLSGPEAYFALRRFTDPHEFLSARSALIASFQRLADGSGAKVLAHADVLDAGELRTFALWIDLGSQHRAEVQP